MKDNLKSPPLALLQPRASRTAKKTETVDIAYDGQQKVSALEATSVERNTIPRKDVNPKKKDRVRDRPALPDGKILRKRKPEEGSGKLGNKYAFQHAESLVANRSHEIILWSSPKTLVHTQARSEMTLLILRAKGDFCMVCQGFQ